MSRFRFEHMTIIPEYRGLVDPRLAFIPQAYWLTYWRDKIHARDGGICQLCGERVWLDWDIDHIQPRSHGGLDTWTNCQLAHASCNRRKGNRV